MSEVVRDEKGWWQKGTPSPNPKGRNGNTEGWQKYGDRLIAKAKELTVEQIKEAMQPERTKATVRALSDTSSRTRVREHVSDAGWLDPGFR